MQMMSIFSLQKPENRWPVRAGFIAVIAAFSFYALPAFTQAQKQTSPAAKPSSQTTKAANDQQGPLTSTLSAFIVEKDKDGKDTFTPATNVRPGQIIEYRALYRNVGKETLERLAMTLPVPAGTVYVDKSASPSRGVLAAINGSTAYAPVPLVRVIKDANGKDKTVPVPLQEYRSLRWELPRLEAGKNVEVKIRVRVAQNTDEEAPAQR